MSLYLDAVIDPIICDDNDDIDDNQNGVSAELGCLACHTVDTTSLWRQPNYTIAICCNGCGETLIEVRS